jgi:hypothetical protein
MSFGEGFWKMRMRDRRASEKKDRELLDFARVYLSEAFPNPDREGCPADSELRSLALNPRESGPEVTEHLAACSPCFRRYGELLAEVKSQREAQKGFPWGTTFVWLRTHPVLTGSAAVSLLLIAIGVGLLLRGTRQPNPPPIETNRKPNPTEPQNPTVASLPFSLDLSGLSPIRGSETAPTGTQRSTLVPNSPLNLTLTLPLASPEGRYDLKLRAGGQTVWSKSAQAHVQKGKTLIHVEADFRQIQTGNYSLEVRSPTGIRFIEPVSIQPPLPNGREQKP